MHDFDNFDPYFAIHLLEHTPNPGHVMYAAMHQDYYEGSVGKEYSRYLETMTPESAEEAAVRILKHGHFGVLEHVSITVASTGFPHSVMQQLRTHRTGISFDVQSFRYTGTRIEEVGKKERNPEEVFYVRPLGAYVDREGRKYEYEALPRQNDLGLCALLAQNYTYRINAGFAPEHARSIIPFDVRQNFVLSANLRTMLHLLDLRAKSDAQLECQVWCHHLLPVLRQVAPQVTSWYEKSRLGKGRLAP